MDFSLDETQAMLADSVEKFLHNDYDFDTRQKYAASDVGYSEDVWRQFAELGWTAVPFAEDDGGFGGGPVELMLLMERLGRGMVVEPYLANIILAGGALRRGATTAQKSEWLDAIIGGELQATLAFAEPHARYDTMNIRTTATKVEKGWSISGEKCFVLNGRNARLLLIPARTSDAETDASGITLFAILRDQTGISIKDYATVDGQQAASIVLDGVVVDNSSVIGKINHGGEVLAACVDDATLAVSAEAVGVMTLLIEKTIEYTKSRVQFGVPISSFQALQHRLVDMFTACEQSRSLLLWATMTHAEDSNASKRAIHSAKYQVSKAGTKVGEEAVQMHGGMGVTWELDVAHLFKRLTVISQIFGNADWHLDRLAD